MRSRYDTSQQVDDSGKLEPLIFQPSDLEICKVLSPNRQTRAPWSYQYLTSEYIAKLLGRSVDNVGNRCQRLKDEPHNYLALPEQPESNYGPIIYSIGDGGIDELRADGVKIKDTRLRLVPHELGASMVAASFEYATRVIPGVSIELEDDDTGEKARPDWPCFWLTTPYQRKRIRIEMDIGRMQIHKNADGQSIEEKFENYLEMDHIEEAFIAIVTAVPSRVMKMNEKLKEVIDRKDLPRHYARSFGFTSMKYNRFLTKIPHLTEWAVSGNWQQPAGTFSLMKPGR